MKLIKISLILLLFLVTSLSAQDKPAYKLYNNKGKEIRYDKMIKDLEGRDMVFFGEYHTNPISHWLELEVAQSLYELRGEDLLLGAEMFDNSLQLILNEYLMGFYEDDKLIPEITTKWGNYVTDYKPLVEFSKEHGIPFLATNIPRRYASMIYKKGIESLQELSPEARAMIGPDLEKYFDPTVKAYAEMEEKMGEHVPPDMLNIQTAQASKDATMAHFALKNFSTGKMLLHFQGSYHSNYDQGIIWWINKIQPGLDIMSLTTVNSSEWEEFSEEEINTIADFIIVVPDNMTQTSRRN